MTGSLTFKNLLLIVFVTFLWALCFPLIEFGHRAAAPLQFATLRSFLAGDVARYPSFHYKAKIIFESNNTGDETMETMEMPKSSVRKLAVPIHGFACGGGGALQLERQIEKLKGVGKVYVNPATSEASLEVSEDFRLDEMLRLIEKNGFRYEEPMWI